MLKKLLSKFTAWRKKRGPVEISFACSVGGYYVSTPVELARQIIPQWLKDQVRGKPEEPGCPMGMGKKRSAKFVRCPGMHDMIQQGFIISAHTDIHIQATKHSVNVDTPNALQELRPQAMDFEVVDGIAPIVGTERKVIKVPLPWSVHMPEGYSAHVMPAYYHFPFFDKLTIYPGTVEYDGFHTINFIFSPIVECDFVIPAHTPLIQLLPFKREDFHGLSGPATQLQLDRHKFGMASRLMGAYRRRFYRKKTYTIEVTK